MARTGDSSSSSSLPWREAASLIIVTRASVPQIVGSNLGDNMIATSRVIPSSSRPVRSVRSVFGNVDYRLLMVKRSNLASFLASAFVFPGGKVDSSDYSSDWWSIFQATSPDLDQNRLMASIRDRVNGVRPPIITQPLTMPPAETSLTHRSPLPSDLALRITAIRETFEETGVLLLTGSNGSVINDSPQSYSSSSIDLASWREKVHSDGYQFIKLCQLLKLCPNVWSLYEWWDWLTPKSVGHRRFDTMFYVTCLDKQPKVIVDNKEVTTLKWCSPIEMLEEHAEGNTFLAPPQVYELSRLHNLPNYRSLRDYVRNREKLGVERWFPVISTYIDGAISFLPGDNMYPENPDYTGTDPVPDFDETLSQVREKSSNLNRLELRGPFCVCLSNQQLSCGHYTPISYDSIASAFQSKL